MTLKGLQGSTTRSGFLGRTAVAVAGALGLGATAGVDEARGGREALALQGRASDRLTAGDTGGSQSPAEETMQIFAKTIYSGVSAKRGIIALRFDDNYSNDYTLVKPLLDAALLPAGFAIVQNRLNAATYTTTAQMLQAQADGHEIMCHSRTLSSDPTSVGQFQDETLGATADMLAAGFYVNSFVQPGTWVGAYHWKSLAALAPALELLLENYAAAEGYIVEDNAVVYGLKPLPARYRYGATHQAAVNTTPGSDSTLGQLRTLVDSCVRFGGMVEILFHSSFIGTASHLSAADFAAFVTYLQAARDAGRVDVLTPTAALYAAVAPYKTNFVNDPGFEETAAGVTFPPAGQNNYWFNLGWVPSCVAGAGRPIGAAAASQAAKVSNGNALCQQFLDAHTGRSWRIDGWARSAETGSVVARMTVAGYRSSNATPIVTKSVTASVGHTYTQMSLLVGTHPFVDDWLLTLDVSGGGSAYFDDISRVKT